MTTIDNTPEEFTIAGHILNAIEKVSMSMTLLPTLTLPQLRSFDPSNVNGGVVKIIIGYSYFQHGTVSYKIGNEYK